jgi:hypothetical protein
VSHATITANQAHITFPFGIPATEAEPESLTPLADAVARRSAEFAADRPPVGGFATWADGQIALLTIRLDGFPAKEDALARDLKRRAQRYWEEDRRLAAEDRLASLGTTKTPGKVVARLRQTRQGAELLIHRWDALANAAEFAGAWTDAQRRMVFELLGTPAALRSNADLPADADGQTALARARIADLRQLKASALDALDAEARHAAETGASFESSPEARALRREEASCRRTLQWIYRQLDDHQPERTAAPSEPAESSPNAILEAMVEALEAMNAPADLPEPEPEPVAPAPIEEPQPKPSRQPVLTMSPSASMNRRARRVLKAMARGVR